MFTGIFKVFTNCPRRCETRVLTFDTKNVCSFPYDSQVDHFLEFAFKFSPEFHVVVVVVVVVIIDVVVVLPNTEVIVKQRSDRCVQRSDRCV